MDTGVDQAHKGVVYMLRGKVNPFIGFTDEDIGGEGPGHQRAAPETVYQEAKRPMLIPPDAEKEYDQEHTENGANDQPGVVASGKHHADLSKGFDKGNGDLLTVFRGAVLHQVVQPFLDFFCQGDG